MIDFPPLGEHLLAAWPTDANRKMVVESYENMARQPLLLTDIALQAGLFSENTGVRDSFEAAIYEGRRQMAVRIIKAANTDPILLFQYFERRKPDPGVKT